MNILMINSCQFGYMAGYYHYCKYLTILGHHVFFVCNDQHHKKIPMEGVDVYYCENVQHSVKWKIDFINIINLIYKHNHIDVALCSYYRGCSLLPILFLKHRMIIDIRSGDLSQNRKKRYFFNKVIKLESLFFSNSITLSHSLAKMLHLSVNRCYIIPLGADIMSEKRRDYHPLNLLYVGTFRQRNIGQTLDGLQLFHTRYPNVDFRYDIIGFGSKFEEQEIKDKILLYNFESKVFFHGRKNYEELEPFFDMATVGIAYVPCTDYYECQPSTKIFEYVLSGIYCIATSTTENKLTISDTNGIVCDDNADSFASALEKYLLMDKSQLSEMKIRQSLQEYQWKEIVNNKLIPVMESRK